MTIWASFSYKLFSYKRRRVQYKPAKLFLYSNYNETTVKKWHIKKITEARIDIEPSHNSMSVSCELFYNLEPKVVFPGLMTGVTPGILSTGVDISDQGIKIPLARYYNCLKSLKKSSSSSRGRASKLYQGGYRPFCPSPSAITVQRLTDSWQVDLQILEAIFDRYAQREIVKLLFL